MTSSLEQRESAFEAEFAHREELKFRVREVAVKALALWAARRLGKTDSAAYAAEVVGSDVASPTLDTTVARIVADLVPAGVGQAEVDRMMNGFLAEAEAAVRAVR